MKITIIISYYKALDNLKIILDALNKQSDMNFELILSEDDSNEETINYLKNNSSCFNFKIQHLFQKEDNGFRKNYMLNRAISLCKTDYMVFIDGDCVPHHHFVKEYKKNLRRDYFFIGRAVMLDEKLSNSIRKKQSLHKFNFLSIFFSNSKHKKDGIYFPFFNLHLSTKGLVGRNWGIYRQHLIDVNGFDNDYVKAGVGEDVDIEWRLLANGIKRKSIKNRAIVFHLYHKKAYSELNVAKNYKLLADKKQMNNIKCINGINKLF